MRSGAERQRQTAARFDGFHDDWSASNRTAHSYRTDVNQTHCGVGMFVPLCVRPADQSALRIFFFFLWFLCLARPARQSLAAAAHPLMARQLMRNTAMALSLLALLLLLLLHAAPAVATAATATDPPPSLSLTRRPAQRSASPWRSFRFESELGATDTTTATAIEAPLSGCWQTVRRQRQISDTVPPSAHCALPFECRMTMHVGPNSCSCIALCAPSAHSAPVLRSPSLSLSLCAPLLQSFLLPVRVGSQQFALQLDTTSSVLAVAMRDCAGCHYVAPLYAPAGSTTAVPTGVTAAQRYPDGSEWRGL